MARERKKLSPEAEAEGLCLFAPVCEGTQAAAGRLGKRVGRTGRRVSRGSFSLCRHSGRVAEAHHPGSSSAFWGGEKPRDHGGGACPARNH